MQNNNILENAKVPVNKDIIKLAECNNKKLMELSELLINILVEHKNQVEDTKK